MTRNQGVHLGQDDLTIGENAERPEQSATQVAGDVEISLPLAGLVDVAEEEKRLQKEIAKVQKDVDLFTKKLSNEKFVANAPAHVLEKDRGGPSGEPGEDSGFEVDSLCLDIEGSGLVTCCPFLCDFFGY